MSDLFNHCTKCGCELSESESQMASESNIPPLCQSCIKEALMNTVKQMESAMKNIAQEVNKALQPMVEDFLKVDRRQD